MSTRSKVMTYMLRRFLHRYNYQETVDEAAKLCPRYRIDEVMWLPVAQMPLLGLEPLRCAQSVLPCLRYAHERMAAVGVRAERAAPNAQRV